METVSSFYGGNLVIKEGIAAFPGPLCSKVLPFLSLPYKIIFSLPHLPLPVLSSEQRKGRQAAANKKRASRKTSYSISSSLDGGFCLTHCAWRQCGWSGELASEVLLLTFLYISSSHIYRIAVLCNWLSCSIFRILNQKRDALFFSWSIFT